MKKGQGGSFASRFGDDPAVVTVKSSSFGAGNATQTFPSSNMIKNLRKFVDGTMVEGGFSNEENRWKLSELCKTLESIDGRKKHGSEVGITERELGFLRDAQSVLLEFTAETMRILVEGIKYSIEPQIGEIKEHIPVGEIIPMAEQAERRGRFFGTLGRDIKGFLDNCIEPAMKKQARIRG